MGDRLRLQAIYAAALLQREVHRPGGRHGEELPGDPHPAGAGSPGGPEARVYKGSPRYLPSETEPVASPAAEHLAKTGRRLTPRKTPCMWWPWGPSPTWPRPCCWSPPSGIRSSSCGWGATPTTGPKNNEFNLAQDVAAARVVFGCGAAVVQLPCMGGGVRFPAQPRRPGDLPEGQKPPVRLPGGHGAPGHGARRGAYLEPRHLGRDRRGLAGGGDFLEDRLEHSPIPEYGDRYSFDHNRHFIRYVYHVYRDRLFADLVAKLTQDS